MTRETISSYMRGLAAVNHLAEDDLADTVAVERWTSVAVVMRRFTAGNLAAVTGHSAEKLTRALPELAQPQHRFSAHRVIQACPRCRRHRGGTVLIHPLPHQHVCVRHNIWLGTLGAD